MSWVNTCRSCGGLQRYYLMHLMLSIYRKIYYWRTGLLFNKKKKHCRVGLGSISPHIFQSTHHQAITLFKLRTIKWLPTTNEIVYPMYLLRVHSNLPPFPTLLFFLKAFIECTSVILFSGTNLYHIFSGSIRLIQHLCKSITF